MIVDGKHVERLMRQVAPNAMTRCEARNTDYGIQLIWAWEYAGVGEYCVRNINQDQLYEYKNKISAIAASIENASEEIRNWTAQKTFIQASQ